MVQRLKLPEEFFSEIINLIQELGEIPAEKLQGTRERLETLYEIAGVVLSYSSRQARTDLNEAVKNIGREIDQLRRTLRHCYWLIRDPLRLAAVDLWLQEEKTAELIVPSRNTELLEEPLCQLTKVLAHLQEMAAGFDRIKDMAGLLGWIEQGGLVVHREVRAELSTYFVKGGGIKPDTLILRNIAQLYKYVFDRDFSIPSSDNSVHYERKLGAHYLESSASSSKTGEPRELPRYTGPGLLFAKAIIELLGLQSCFVAYKEEDLGFHSRVTDEGPPDKFDLINYNRELALAGRSVDPAKLTNRIGDTWKNETKRRKKAPSSPKASSSSKAAQS